MMKPNDPGADPWRYWGNGGGAIIRGRTAFRRGFIIYASFRKYKGRNGAFWSGLMACLRTQQQYNSVRMHIHQGRGWVPGCSCGWVDEWVVGIFCLQLGVGVCLCATCLTVCVCVCVCLPTFDPRVHANVCSDIHLLRQRAGL